MALVPMTDAVLGGVGSSADNNAIIDNVLDLDARLGAVTSGSTAHARLTALETRTTDTVTAPGGIGNQRLADRLDTGVGTGSNVTTGSASAQLGNLRSRVTTLEGSATVDTAGRIVARAVRVTTSTGSLSTVLVPVLRLSGLGITNGRVYKISWMAHLNDPANNGDIRIELHYTTNNTLATTASPILPGSQCFLPETGNPGFVETTLTAGAGQTLSLLLAFYRNSGTNTMTLFADGDRSTQIVVQDGGVDPGNGGTDL